MGKGFCYPGVNAKGGDRPPRKECAPLWHPKLLPLYTNVELILLVGPYAVNHYLPNRRPPARRHSPKLSNISATTVRGSFRCRTPAGATPAC